MAGRRGILLAILTSVLAQLTEAATRGTELWSSKVLGAQQVQHRHSSRNVQGSKVGMHHEDLLFRRQKLHKRHKAAHRLALRNANLMEVIHKTAYWGTVKLGTPAQEFKVIFDTGSGNLIIPAESCNMAGCNAHKKYSPSDSSTAAKVINEKGEGSTEISFGTGDISGDYYTDKFCIAEQLCTQVRFVAATDQSAEPFSETPFDGILGLGVNDRSMGENFNIVDALNANGQLPSGTFAVFLTEDSSSEITFGGYKPDQVASEIVWAKVTHESYWQVATDDITFNNVETGLCNGGCQVAVDTGTSMLAGPSDLVQKLTDKLHAKDDCSNFDELPNIGFKIKNKVLNLAPEDYMDKSAGDCSFSIMSLDVPPPKGPLFIFGDPFLRRFVTIYDRDGPRVGFAVAKHGSLDAADASKIISDVAGSAQGESSTLEVNSKSKEAPSSAVVLNLEAGMMTRDGGSADHVSSSSDSDDEENEDLQTKSTATSRGAGRDRSRSSSSSDTSLGDDFTAAVDKWLLGTTGEEPADRTAHHSPSEASEMRRLFGGDSLMQQKVVGLRGRHAKGKQLVSVRLHKMPSL